MARPAREDTTVASLTRSQRRARAAARVADARRNPGRTAVAPIIRERVTDENGDPVTLVTPLASNPNRGKRSGAPMNHEVRTIHSRTLSQSHVDYDRLRVATPLRTPTGRIARQAGQPLYSQYTLASDRRRTRGDTVTTRPRTGTR